MSVSKPMSWICAACGDLSKHSHSTATGKRKANIIKSYKLSAFFTINCLNCLNYAVCAHLMTTESHVGPLVQVGSAFGKLVKARGISIVENRTNSHLSLVKVL